MPLTAGSTEQDALRPGFCELYLPQPTAPSLPVAVCLTMGAWLAGWTSVPPLIWLTLCCMVCLLLCVQPISSPFGSWTLLAGSILVGAFAWSSRILTTDATDVTRLLDADGATCRVAGIVDNIPSLRASRETAWRSEAADSAMQTLFYLEVTHLFSGEIPLRASGRLRVLISGDAISRLSWKQPVQVIGRIERRFVVSNPGEFDYGAFLKNQSVSGLLFVRHPDAVKTLRNMPIWHPWTALSELRQQAVRLIRQNLSEELQPLAEALMLGNRGHMDPAVERDFVASGTMHLLSISGLHVGILYLFLIRILNLLLTGRRTGMLLGLMFCVAYALLTDLRASVLRSTLFIVLTVSGQLLRRNLRMSTLIGNTAVILFLWDPAVVYDLGAWLSFLAVSALAWAGTENGDDRNHERPADGLTWADRLRDLVLQSRASLKLRYRQMFAVTVFSMPLVASQFHVISVSGLVANIVLIPLTGITMISGFIFLLIGLLIPASAGFAGTGFNYLLMLMNRLVADAGNLTAGSLTIPDTPFWFLVLYYVLLTVAVASGNAPLRRNAWVMLSILVLAGFWNTNSRVFRDELICTVLNVGHGNAIVVETPDGRVLVFDAGALNRGERTADIVSRFLWHQGQSRIDALIISHADMDHYNAVTGLIDRMPVDQILTSAEFVGSQAAPVVRLLETLRNRQMPIRLLNGGDWFEAGQAEVQFRQAVSPSEMDLDDNELSIVGILEFAGRRIVLPGDLEKSGQAMLLPEMKSTDVLISPHHGSRVSNTRDTREAFAPELVVVSSRSSENDDYLQRIYGEKAEILNTCLDGAVSIRIRADGVLGWKAWLCRPDSLD